MNKLAFYYDSVQIPQDHIMENLKEYLYGQVVYNDFIIFTNIMFPFSINHSILPTFYSKFFTGTIVFFDSDDYDASSHTDKLLYTHNVTESLDKNYNIVAYDESHTPKYRIIKYDKLQQII